MKKYKSCVCVLTQQLWKTKKDASRTFGTHRAVVFLDEQRRHPRPLEPAITLRPTPKNMFVEREIECDSAQPLPAISKVFPVAWPTGNSSTDFMP